MITQANIRSILPGKIANVAMLLSKRKGISGMEALRMFYCSDVYSKLEREEAKYWWQSPEQLTSLILHYHGRDTQQHNFEEGLVFAGCGVMGVGAN